MPATLLTHGTISINKIQPKFKGCLLTGKAKAHLRSWIKLIGGIVRNIKNGHESHSLEDFLDFYLKRNTRECSTAPNFLQEGALQTGDGKATDFTPNRTPSSPASESEVVITRRPPAYEDDELPPGIPENATDPNRSDSTQHRPTYTRYRGLFHFRGPEFKGLIALQGKRRDRKSRR